MKTVVVLDACVLFPMPLCDTLLRMAENELYRLHLSQEILDEATCNLVKKERMTPKKANRYQEQIKKAFPESIITGYEKLIPLMTNDPKDRHVLACAVKAKADVIVTYNLKDFSTESTEPFNIKVQHPDDFLLDLMSEYGFDKIIAILQQQADDLKNPPICLRDLLQRFKRETPDFYKIVFCRIYAEVITNIATSILSKIGKESPNGIRYYQGTDYYLEQSSNSLIIKHKQKGQILKGINNPSSVEMNFTIEDLGKFEDFEKAMNEKLDKNIKK